MDEIKIFGFKRKKTIDDWRQRIEHALEDGMYDFYLSKQVYNYDNPRECVKFSYRYLINITDRNLREGDGKPGYFIDLQLAIEPSLWHKDVKEEIAKMCGIKEDEVNILDGYWDGGVEIPLKSIYTPNEDKDVILFMIANILDAIDARRNDYFNKAWNKAGTTGWDTIRHTLKNLPLF